MVFKDGLLGSPGTEVQLHAALATPVMLANQPQTTYLLIGLTGLNANPQTSIPVNVALVIDKSASMQGPKMQHAKAAAKMIVERLRPDDIIALISYDHHVEVLLPATQATNKEAIYVAISKLAAGGNTALFSGIERGAKELHKFLSPQRINRMVLVSDGHANVGPDSPEEVRILSTTIGQEGIAITTIGLGLDYNEDLMTQLARHSDGHHAFAEHPHQLTHLFTHELGNLLAVVAQQVKVTILSAEGIQPLRILGREAEIRDSPIVVTLNQLYHAQEQQILLEMAVPPTPANQPRAIADVAISYHNLNTDTTDHLASQLSATFTTSSQLVAAQTNPQIMTVVVEQLALEQNKLAVKLRDQGQIAEAREVLLETAAYLKEQAAKYDSSPLSQLKDLNLTDAQNLETSNWNRQRKIMRQEQYRAEKQRKY
jgi:Ca-activated chloride channel family protein